MKKKSITKRRPATAKTASKRRATKRRPKSKQGRAATTKKTASSLRMLVARTTLAVKRLDSAMMVLDHHFDQPHVPTEEWMLFSNLAAEMEVFCATWGPPCEAVASYAMQVAAERAKEFSFGEADESVPQQVEAKDEDPGKCVNDAGNFENHGLDNKTTDNKEMGEKAA